MNAATREAVDRLDHWLKDYPIAISHKPILNTDVRTLIDAVRQHDRLATEGLTDTDKKFIADYNPAYPATVNIIAKLRAQLTEARQLHDLLLSDPPPAWEAVVLQVTEEVARECEKIAFDERRVWNTDAPDPQHRIAAAIRRRFGLTEAKPSDPQYDERRDRRIEERTP